jgi:hypothetical protein
MLDLTNENEIADLKKSFDYSFKGPLGQKTLQFLEEFCGFELGGPREDINQLQYEAGKRDVILTIKTINKDSWSPKEIAELYKRMEKS